MIISAYHQELNDSFVIEISESKVHQLVNEFGGDYSLMAEHLKIMNKRMVLLNPVTILYFEIKPYLEICESLSKISDT